MPTITATVHLMPFFQGDLLQTFEIVVPENIAGETLGDLLRVIFEIGNGVRGGVAWAGRRSMSVGDVVTIGAQSDAWVVLDAGWRTLGPGEIDRLCAMVFAERQKYLIAVSPES